MSNTTVPLSISAPSLPITMASAPLAVDDRATNGAASARAKQPIDTTSSRFDTSVSAAGKNGTAPVSAVSRMNALIKDTKKRRGSVKRSEDVEEEMSLRAAMKLRRREDHAKFTKHKAKRQQALVARNHSQCRAEMVPERPFRFLDLPREIRDMVYRLWFTRPVAIRPGVLYYSRFLDRFDVRKDNDSRTKRRYSAYRYDWSQSIRAPYRGEYGYQDQSWETNEPSQLSDRKHPNRDGVADHFLRVQWDTLPTPAQWVVINKALEAREEHVGGSELAYPLWLECDLEPTPTESEDASEITHRVQEIEEGRFLVENSQHICTSGFFGVRMFRASKQIFDEARPFLYAHNRFDFQCFDYRTRVLRFEHLDEARGMIPGLANDDDSQPSAEENARALARLFERGWKGKGIWRDQFLKFIHKIGPRNAALLQSVKFEGKFKTVDVAHYDKPTSGRLGFCELLPIYGAVMQLACPHMSQVTLHRHNEQHQWSYDPRGPPAFQWDWDWDQYVVENRHFDQIRISYAVRDFVESLPQLRHLRLGMYDAPRLEEHSRGAVSEQPHDETWGLPAPEQPSDNTWAWALWWVGVVQARTKYPDSWFYAEYNRWLESAEYQEMYSIAEQVTEEEEL